MQTKLSQLQKHDMMTLNVETESKKGRPATLGLHGNR